MPHPIYRIFVSSTFLDLVHERKSVVAAINDLNVALARSGIVLHAIDLREGAAPEPPINVCLEEVRMSDAIVTIVGKVYGSETPAGISFTETEFIEATTSKLHRFAFFKDNSAIYLHDQADTDAEKVRKLQLFRKRIDGALKRDTFTNSDELKSKVMRDLLRWLMGLPHVAQTLSARSPAGYYAGTKTYFEAFDSRDYPRAARILLSRPFAEDMRRHGLRDVHNGMLIDLLGLGKTGSGGALVSDLTLKSGLLLQLAESSRGSLVASVALQQAVKLETEINDPHYTFEVARRQTEAMIEATRFDLAKRSLDRMINAASESKDLHRAVQAQRVIGHFYRAQGDHATAEKAYFEGISKNCSMPEMCPFCLSDAFCDAGHELMALGQCDLANDRFAKSFAAARVAPNRTRQVRALVFLGRHWSHHNEVRSAIAAYLLMGRIAAENDPSDEHANHNLLLAELSTDHGSSAVQSMVAEIEPRVEEIVDEVLKPWELDKFIKTLGLKPSSAGDHW